MAYNKMSAVNINQQLGSVLNHLLIKKMRNSFLPNCGAVIKDRIRIVPIRKPLRTKNNSTPNAPKGCVNWNKLITRKPIKGMDFSGSKNSKVWERITDRIAIALSRSNPKIRSFFITCVLNVPKESKIGIQIKEKQFPFKFITATFRETL